MTRAAGRFSSAALFACAGLLVNGCLGGDVESPSSQKDVEQFAATAIQRVCDILATCCADAHFLYDEQGCKALHSQRIRQHFSTQPFYGSHLDTAAAKRCLDSIGQVSDGCPVDRVGGNLTDECNWLWKGTVPLGGVCSASDGCDSTPDAPLACQREYLGDGRSAMAGVCVAIPAPVYVHGSAGQACTSTCIGDDKDPCFLPEDQGACYTGDGLFCSWETKQCEPQGVSGDPCNGSSECTAGTYCATDDSTCTPIRPLGAACTAWEQCGKNYCTSGTCQRPPRATAEYCVGRIPPPPSN